MNVSRCDVGQSRENTGVCEIVTVFVKVCVGVRVQLVAAVCENCVTQKIKLIRGKHSICFNG